MLSDVEQCDMLAGICITLKVMNTFSPFGKTASSPGDSDGGRAAVFIWKKTTATAAGSDDYITSHPSRFPLCTFPARKEARTGAVPCANSRQIRIPAYLFAELITASINHAVVRHKSERGKYFIRLSVAWMVGCLL